MLDVLLFMARYAPFWGIPMGIISAELCWMMWKRDKKKVSIVFTSVGAFCLYMVVSYYYLGGPERFVQKIIKLYQYLEV